MTMHNHTWRKGAVIAMAGFTLLSQAAWAVSFTDVPASAWVNPYIDYLTGRNIITGYPDNTFRPNRPVTRAEFAVMLAKSQGLPTGAGGAGQFSDVPASHWAAQAIKSVASQGWIAGYPGGHFMPNQNISMAEMYTILSKAGGQAAVSSAEADSLLQSFQDANKVPTWARIPVATAIKNGVAVSELSKMDLYPNIQASRASVATAIAKLVNPSFRVEGGIAQQSTTPSGQAVNVTGTLQATTTPGEWVVVTDAGTRYFFTNPPASLTGQSWFRVGSPVSLAGTVDATNSTAQHTLVTLNNLLSTAPQNQTTITGTLRPSTQTTGAWVVQTADGKVYRILNPEQYTSMPMFRFGSSVTVTGALRPDATLPAADGMGLVASKVETAQTSNELSLTGTLQPTVEAGGWTITVPGTNQKYVLLGTQSVQNQPWFKAGTEVMARGSVKTDVPTIYQEGPVLVLSSITPSPMSTTGTQQVGLYFPNLLNVTKDPATLLGNPTYRDLTGPSIPQKAVQALLTGPNDVERLRGYFADDEIKKLTLNQLAISPDGQATVVLEAPTNFQFKTGTTPTRLNEEINRTLTQFTGIKDVSVSVKDPSNNIIWTSP
jgi:hypothetical protein